MGDGGNMEGRSFLKTDGGAFIIAEAGVNHNGDLRLAEKLIDAAQAAGADAVKFQTWKPGELTGRFAAKVKYLQDSTTGTRYELSTSLALPYEAFRDLQAYSREKGILFLSTPDGFQSLDFLVDDLGMPIIKVSSSEVTHLDFIRAVAGKHLPVILSTGMSTLAEVERCVAILREQSRCEFSLLHCTSEYPAPYDEVNLRAMVTIREAFGIPVGLSDHTIGPEAAIASIALGACVIEKHLTLDRSMPGPDHRASMEPKEFSRLVRSIRITERLLGDGIKRPTGSERANLPNVRRGVVAARGLRRGTILTREMLAAKRPFAGIEPFEMESLVGKRLNRDLEEDEPLRREDLA